MENKVLKVIKSRVSCRAYSEKKVPFGKVMAIAEAGKFAPSAKNRQIANIYVIKSKRLVEKLRTLSMEVVGRDCMYGAKTVILVAGPAEDPFTFQDCSCILENMFVAANALGISSCWINQFNDLFQSKNGLKVKKSLNIPEDHRVVGACILGYPAEGTSLSVKERKEDFIKVL